MLIPKLQKSKSSHNNNRSMTQIPTIKHLGKISKRIENKKDNTEQNYFPKKLKLKRLKVLYRPLHPETKFDSSSMGINEIVKKNNLPLITNDSIKNFILKFREEREKEINEKRVIYKDRSYEDLQKEKNTHFMMLRAMLRRDPLSIQILMKRNDEEEKRLKKNASMLTLMRKRFKKKYFNRTINISEENLKTDKSANNNISAGNSKMVILKKNKFSKHEVWKQDFLSKTESKKKAYLKKHEIKIRSVNSLSLTGRFSPFKVVHSTEIKFNQDCMFSYINLHSSKLEEISLFGIFDGNGQNGKAISVAFKNYIVDYFKKCNNMRLTLNKDNFYSIMYNSFVHAQNYLINNSTRLNINMNYSGATGIVVLYPHNLSNKIYCANLGRNRCIFYSMNGAIRLSYELYPSRASEKDRIDIFKEQRKKELEKKLKEKAKKEEANNQENNNAQDNNNNITTTLDINKNKNIQTKNNMMANNNMMSNNNEEKNIAQAYQKIEQKRKEAIFKEFSELDISRCIGNLAAEELGIIPGPEIGESDVRINKGKFIVMGTESLWRYITEDEIGEIVNAHYFSCNSEGACKDLMDLAKDRWKEKNEGAYDDISVMIIFFDPKNL